MNVGQPINISGDRLMARKQLSQLGLSPSQIDEVLQKIETQMAEQSAKELNQDK